MQKCCIELMNGKKINLSLYEEYAPITVANFNHLIDIEFFNSLIFHRIIKGFMSQGGSYFVQDGKLGEATIGYTIPGEFIDNGFNNPIKHTTGVISMARTNDPNSASSQFFICDADSAFLDGKYAAFGIIADEESMQVLHELSAIPTVAIDDGFENFPTGDLINITIKTVYKIN